MIGKGTIGWTEKKASKSVLKCQERNTEGQGGKLTRTELYLWLLGTDWHAHYKLAVYLGWVLRS